MKKQLSILSLLGLLPFSSLAFADPLRDRTLNATIKAEAAKARLVKAKADLDAVALIKQVKEICTSNDSELCKQLVTSASDQDIARTKCDAEKNETCAKIYEAIRAYTEKQLLYASASKDYAVAREAAENFTRMDANASNSPHNFTLSQRLAGARQVRCLMALCWGGTDGTENGVEAVLDLPISMYWSVGNESLANYVNAHPLQLSLTAGVRYWFQYDAFSIGVILAQPTLAGTDGIRFAHSDKIFPKDAIARPYPTLMLGVFGDIVMLTGSYDELRNKGGIDPNYRADEVLSRTFTFGLSLNAVSAARLALGKPVEGNNK